MSADSWLGLFIVGLFVVAGVLLFTADPCDMDQDDDDGFI